MEEATTVQECADARDSSNTGSLRRRRRPSRRERKQLKKQRRGHQDDDSTAATRPSNKTTAPSTQRSTGSSSSAPETARRDNDPSSQPLQSVESSSVASKQAQSSSTDDDDEDASSPYVPTPTPSLSDADNQHAADQTSVASKKLGKWFPKASVIKSPVWVSNADVNKTPARAALVLFYQYVEPPWPPQRVRQLNLFLERIAAARVLGGRIRVAPEGVNATVSSIDVLAADAGAPPASAGRATTTALTALRHFARDLQNFDDAFRRTDFKFLSDLSPDRHFAQLKLFPVQELVFYGLRSDQAPLSKTGVHLSPEDFHHKLSQPDTVVIDVRNHYEAAIGRFDGQEVQTTTVASPSGETTDGEPPATAGGAKYIDPKMRKSTDFPAWLEASKDQLKGKTCLFYCTGGVRCERASAHANRVLGNDVRGVFQLQGGVEAYLQAYPDGGYWRGKNFVFDNREAVGANNRDGDGGVLRKGKRDKGTASSSSSTETHCCLCGRPWDRYVGKRKCATCGVPVLVCETCLADKSTKARAAEMRCPLCVDQGVTVPAADVEWTSNGTKVVLASPPADRGDPSSTHAPAIAAPSVLKWGGGHAARKKTIRRFRNQPCRFGAGCTRTDCFFAHPGRSEQCE